MRTTLPTKWAIKGENDYEYQAIADYADPLNIKYDSANWSISDSKRFVLCIKNGRYYGGYNSVEDADGDGFELITFEEFERLVLDKSIEPTYEIF